MSNNEALSDLDGVAIYAYLNKGPYLTDIDPNKFYDNPLGVPYSIEIHSSIDGMYRFGSIVFDDRVGIRETLPLTGNEIITIKYKNSSRGSVLGEKPKIIHFNIFDMEETQLSAGDDRRFTNKALKFHLIEAPFFLKYNQNTCNRVFGSDTGKKENGVALDKIFETHLTTDLKIPNSYIKLNFQKMSSELYFYTPFWKSQKALTYLLNFAKDEKGFGNVKFYTTSNIDDGSISVNLKSVNEMFLNKKATEFTLVDSSSFESGKDGIAINQRSINQILTHKFLSYDLSTIPSGFGGGTLISYDYVASRYYLLQNNYKEAIKRKENPFFYNFALWSDKISNDSSRQIMPGPIKKSNSKAFLTNSLIQHQYQLRCETMTYVDETVDVGDKIFVYFLSGMTEVTRDQSHLLDEQMSGAWIVEEIVDACMNGKGFRKMVLVKDSFFNLYDVSTGSGNTKSLPEVNAVAELRNP